MGMTKEFKRLTRKTQVRTPQLLDPAEFEGLCSVFRHFDVDGSGEVSLEELIVKGLIYADQMEAYKKDWDVNGDSCFDMYEFCEMMCPLGFRAYPESKVGTQKDGSKVRYDSHIDGWRLESEMLSAIEKQQEAIAGDKHLKESEDEKKDEDDDYEVPEEVGAIAAV